MGGTRYDEVRLEDGRVLEVLTGGDPDGLPWLFHSGSPSSAVAYRPIDEAARGQGLRLITYSRPGYGESTPRPIPDAGPRFADDVPDIVELLEALGVDRFVTLGWSGGGPRALACAALLPDRCLAAATLAGVAPKDGKGLDWFDGMAPENVEEYTVAEEGLDAYEAHMATTFLPLRDVTAEAVAGGMGELLTPVDLSFLQPEFAEYLASSFRRAAAQGVIGVRDDGLAAVAPWGFDLASITVPVAVWQGRADAMVPYAHGEWLAQHVPGARGHLLDAEGHLSLIARIDEILADLKRLAGL